MKNLQENPLITAIANNNLDKVKELVEAGFEIEKLDNSDFIDPNGHITKRLVIWSPIDLAISLKRKEITEYLLKRVDKINTTIRHEVRGERE